MVIIFQKGANFWIESFEFARASLAAGTAANTTFTLERPGIHIGHSCTKNTAGGFVETQLLSAIIFRNVGGDQLLYGENISTFLLQRTNGNAGAEFIGAEILIYMRKNQ